MGIIARQTIKGSLYSYLGALIGFINVGLIMPQIFSTAEIGLTNLLISLAAIFGQLGSLGFLNVTIKLFPFFRDTRNKNNGFLFLLLSIGTLGFIVCAIAYYIWKPYLIAQNIEKSPLFAEYVYLLIPLIFISIFHLLVDTYNRVLFNASFGIFVKEFLLRILNLIIIGLFYFRLIDFHAFILLYILAYGVPLLLICLLLVFKNQISLNPSFSFLNKKFVKEIISVAGFGLISGFSGIVLLQIDKYLVNHYCNLSATGVYATSFFFGTMILLPSRSLIRISCTIISEALKADEYKKIDDIYKRSTLNLTMLGLFLFVLILGNLNNIMLFLPPDFSSGKYVILFIALAHLFQMMAGVSGEIIQFSKYYRQHTVIILVVIVSIVGLNVLLLPVLGIIGAAISYATSFLIYFLIRVIYVKIKFGFQPYSKKHLLIIAIGVFSLLISLVIPQINNFIIDGIIRSSLISVVFVAPIIYFNLSPETNDFLLKLLAMIKVKINKK
jgi:O-antigen/teichoic acid export membrane protein